MAKKAAPTAVQPTPGAEKAAPPAKSAPTTKKSAPAKTAPTTTAAPATPVLAKAAPAAKKAPAKAASKPAPEAAAEPVATPAEPVAAPPQAAPAAAAPSGPPTLVVREEEDPWTPVELDEVRAELTAELERLAHDIAALETSIADVLRDSGDGAGDDQADTGSKAFEREQEMTLLANARDTVFQTQHALKAIADGTYGRCESCGNAIGKARLQAFPRATLCVACKQRQERR